ncbi:MAG: 6-pyruvoyl-tetrahydropterin synthase-related protein [Candidatus Altiarchaeia archaeon]
MSISIKKILRNAKRRWYKFSSTNFYPAAVLLIFLISFYGVSPSLQEGYLIGWDNPAHLVHAKALTETLDLHSLGVWGWYPGWYLGIAHFIFYTPGFYFLVSAVYYSLLGFLSLNTCLKLIVALSYALFPVAIYWMTKNLGYGKRVALYASVFSMAAHTICGLGLDAIYAIGLYNHHFSIVLFAVFLGMFNRTMRDKKDRLYLPAGLLLGFLFISHIITTFYSFLALGIYFAVGLIYRKKINIKKYLSVFLICLLTSSFWLYPFLSSQYLTGMETGFGILTLDDMYKKITTENFLMNPLIVQMAILGLAAIAFGFIFLKKRPLESVFIVVMLVITFVVSSDAVVKELDKYKNEDPVYKLVQKGFHSLLMTRSVTYLGVLIPLLAAIGMDSFFGLAAYFFRKWRIIVEILSLAVFSYLLFFCATEQYTLAKNSVKIIQIDYKEPYQMFNETFVWMKSNLPSNSVVKTALTGSKFSYPGFYATDSMMNLETGLRTVGGNQIEACQLNMCSPMGVLDYIPSSTDGIIRENLFRYGVNYVLFGGPGKLTKPYLEEVYANKDLTLYKVVNLGDQRYRITSLSTDYRGAYLEIESDTVQETQIPIQYNDHFTAKVNGIEQIPVRGETGLVKLELRPGVNEINLVFERKPMESLIVLMSFASVLLVLFVWIKGWKRRPVLRTKKALL